MGDRGCPCGPNGPRSPVFEAEAFAAAAEAAGALTEGFDEAEDLPEPVELANRLWFLPAVPPEMRETEEEPLLAVEARAALLPAVPPEMRETEDEPLLAVLAGFEGAERVTAPALPPAGDVRVCP